MAEKKRLILIDSLALIHRAYHALPPLATRKGELVNAVYGFLLVLFKVLREFQPDFVAAAFDAPGPTFREEEYKEYKAKRPPAPDELYNQIPRIKQILEAFNIPIYEKQGFEADDIIGMISEKAPKKQIFPEIETIIVTGDKDTFQLIDQNTKVFTLRKGVRDTVLYDEKAIRERYGIAPQQLLDFKALRGDPSDNIPGVPGIGEKTAAELIQEFGNIENLYEEIARNGARTKKLKQAVREKLITNKDLAFLSKKLVTIRKDVPLEFKIQDAEWAGYDKSKVEAILGELEFFSLIEKLPGISLGQSLKKTQSISPPRKSLLGSRPRSPELALGSRGRSASETLFSRLPQAKSMDTLKEIEELYRQGIFSKEIYELEKALVPVIEEMEGSGIKIDLQKLEEISRNLGLELQGLESKIYKLAGNPFNINSSQQVSAVLFKKLGLATNGLKKTPGGVVSTSAPELEKLKDKHEIVGLIQGYRELNKLKTGFVDALSPLVDPKDGKIHPQWHQLGTATGRISCSNPNLQNIPIRGKWGKEIRKAFIAQKGYRLLSADYSQMELRVAAHISQDQKMIEAFQKGKDIHKMTAAEIYNVSEEKVTEEMRYHAKTLNFGVLYGMGPRAFSQSAGIAFSEAQKFIREYMSDFSGIKNYIERTKQEAREKGFVQTLFGRKRFIPEIVSVDPRLQAAAERMAANMPVQGCSADIMKMAMVAINDQLLISNNQCKLLLQIHDELLFEIEEGQVLEFAPKIKEIMENVYELNVPLKVDIKVGANWGGMEDLKMSI